MCVPDLGILTPRAQGQSDEQPVVFSDTSWGSIVDTITGEKLPGRGWNQAAYPLTTYVSRVFRTISESTWGILLALLGDQICDFHTVTYYL